jgi:urease accessory protein
MSISIRFDNDVFSLEKLQLPTRYYHFDDCQNYIKLVSIGEGLFPGDKIRTNIQLDKSDLVITTESATKVYPTNNLPSTVKVNVDLHESNLEFINDEIILHETLSYCNF